MSDIDPERLAKAVAAWGPLSTYEKGSDTWLVVAAAEAHLATLPRYEEVDVWRVEWAATGGVPCIDQHTDKSFVEQVAEEKRNFGRQCIRVTGPHKQRVPA